MEEAKLGILEIMEQGEGSVPASGEYNPSEPYGTYNHYGKRTDGTYGPILGTPYEMSHFKKFRSIALDTDNFPETYPIVSNARLSDFENKLLIIASEAFDFAYSIMLDALERSFYKPKSPTEPDMFFAVVLPVMHSVLPSLARIMMTTPIRKNINAKTGPNGAPLFLYKDGCSINDLPAKLEKVVALANEESSENNNIGVIVSSLEEALISMKESISK